jgi:flagellar export protein FliJ
MAKNRYKLQPVLNVREKAKQEAARVVAARRSQLAEAEAELVRREQELADCRARQTAAQSQMAEAVKEGAEIRHLVIHRTHLADLRESEQQLMRAVEQQTATVAFAEREVDKAVDALIEAAKELQVVEKHREGWQQRLRREDARREQKLNDEMGTILHERRSRD